MTHTVVCLCRQWYLRAFRAFLKSAGSCRGTGQLDAFFCAPECGTNVEPAELSGAIAGSANGRCCACCAAEDLPVGGARSPGLLLLIPLLVVLLASVALLLVPSCIEVDLFERLGLLIGLLGCLWLISPALTGLR